MPYFDVHGDKFTTLNSIRTPRIARAIGFSLIFVIVLIALFLAFVPWVQTASGPGKVTALNPNPMFCPPSMSVSRLSTRDFVQSS